MEQQMTNDRYQVIKVELAAGRNMPRHHATSATLLVVESGSALLIFPGETYELGRGEHFSIPAGEQHLLKIIEDFKAYIILANGAQLQYPGFA